MRRNISKARRRRSDNKYIAAMILTGAAFSAAMILETKYITVPSIAKTLDTATVIEEEAAETEERQHFAEADDSYILPASETEADIILLSLEHPETIALSEEETECLLRIAQAEAEGEGVWGKALVMRVVLNRKDSDSFPDTVSKAINQRGAFTPVANGRYKAVTPDEECEEALGWILDDWDESEGALYFERTSTGSTWHSRNLKELFTYGRHTFYKEYEDEDKA